MSQLLMEKENAVSKIDLYQSLIKVTNGKISFKNSKYAEDFVNPDMMHKTVQSFFGSARLDKKVLYCLDDDGDCKTLHIRSLGNPNFSTKPYGDKAIYVSKEIEDKTIVNGDLFKFSLKANVLKRLNGKDIHIKDFDGIKNWIFNKSNNCGFSISNKFFNIEGPSVKSAHKGRTRINLNEVTYSGVLRVDNCEDFYNCLVNGIGRNKNFGYGMLIIDKIKK